MVVVCFVGMRAQHVLAVGVLRKGRQAAGAAATVNQVGVVVMVVMVVVTGHGGRVWLLLVVAFDLGSGRCEKVDVEGVVGGGGGGVGAVAATTPAMGVECGRGVAGVWGVGVGRGDVRRCRFRRWCGVGHGVCWWRHHGGRYRLLLRVVRHSLVTPSRIRIVVYA